MARREQLDYLIARLRVQDKYLQDLTEISSSNLVAESNELSMSEQSHRRRAIRFLVDEFKCGLCDKIGMLELYLHSSFQRAVEVEVESRLRQMKDLAAVRANIDAASDIQDRVARHHDDESDFDRLKRMEIELRCGICSELMVSATTLNCMHTYCQCCITHWKTFEEHRGTVARCPVCREFTVSEKRNYFADNLIGIIVDGYPEEEKNRRKELVASHQELLTQNVVTLPETNSANPSSVNLFGLFMTEIKKMLEDIKKFLAETSVLPVMPLIQFDPEPPQPTRPEQLPSSLVVTVVPVLGLPRGSSAPTLSGIHRLNQQRVYRGREQRGRQTRPTNGGIPGPQPQSIQRAANRRNQQSSARPVSGRKVHGSLLARPHWRY